MENPVLDLESSSCCKEQEQKVDVLLEKGWFFGNLLNNNINRSCYKVISRCNSAPSPSSVSKNPIENRNSLARAPSFPVDVRIISQHQQKEWDSHKPVSKKLERSSSVKLINSSKFDGVEEEKVSKSDSKIAGKSVSEKGLLRSDSLPRLCLDREEIPDEESYARLSNLIRLALPDVSDSSARRQKSKGMIHSCSRPRTRPPRNSEAETIDPSPEKEIKHQNLIQTRLRRTKTTLEFDENKTFKLENENKSLTESQEKRKKFGRRKSYSSSSSPPIPNRVIKEPTHEDMKTQIKFWARAVACNVRQEC